MKDFIEIRDTADPAEFTHTEVIRTSDLIKMFKGEGDSGETIHFVFYDTAIGRQRTFIAAYGTTTARDIAFDSYEEALGVAVPARKSL